jgi:hypothetical protein
MKSKRKTFKKKNTSSQKKKPQTQTKTSNKGRKNSFNPLKEWIG